MPLVSAKDVTEKTFDYVVVGGGTAGLTLAARLSEDTSNSVLVLEAGGANIDDPAILRPASWGSHFGQEKYDWGHKTVAQKHSNNIQYDWPRGKGLGGSSAINFMCWTRPPVSEIDDFEKLGNDGWNWKNLEKYSQKLERYIAPSKEVAEKSEIKVEGWTNGTEGSVVTSFPGNIPDAELTFQKTMLNLGFKHANSPLGGDPEGVYLSVQTVDPATYTRSYSTTAFYLPAKERKNLSVVVDALVGRIVTEKNAAGQVVAKEVEFTHEGQTHLVKIGKEVVLSAGALKSPQILELSGIGKKEALSAVGVPVQLELPGVGENLQEHVYACVTYELKDGVDYDTLDVLRNPDELQKNLKLHSEGKGLFTMGITGFSFAPLQAYSERANEIHKAAAEKIEKNKATYPPGLYEQYQVQLQRLKDGAPGCEIVNIPAFLSFPNPPAPGKKYWTILCAMNHQFSRGTVHSISNDPKVDPAYDPHYFEEQIDLDTIVECIKFARRLKDVAPFKDIVVAETNPGPNCTTDEDVTQWVKSYLATTYHTASTLSMLPKEKGGVVDAQLKVYGTENIRVCDLSVIPLHFAAHPQATIYAIAERAADIIKGRA